MAYHAVDYCRVSVTYSQSDQPVLIGYEASHTLCIHVTRSVSCLLLSLRNCGVCPLITKNNRCTTCTAASNSTVPEQYDARFSFDCTTLGSTPCLVSLGLIFWLDGWDPSASSKNNRSPIHTASVTLLCIDNLTGFIFNARTFPIACGPGKADHNIIFQALRTSLDKLTASEDIVWSNQHGRWTTIRAHVIAFLMDQPERRGTNGLLGGNAKQHGTFGVSCDFEHLERRFSACPKCVRVANRYLKEEEFGTPMEFSCRLCYSSSLSRLFEHGKYLTSCHTKLTVDTPGFELTSKPGFISFEIFTAQ